MRTLLYTNPEGDSILLGEGYYGINSLTGIDAPNITNQEQKAPYQDGSTPIDQLYGPREIVVEGIIAEGTLTGISARRRAMIMALNAKLGPGTILLTVDAGSFTITGRPDEVRFANKNANEPFQRYQVVFYCHDPFFYEGTERSVSLSTIAPPVIIENDGDIFTPITVELSGGGTNPYLEELVQSKRIEIDGVVDDPLIITTAFGNKNILKKNSGIWKLVDDPQAINAFEYSAQRKIIGYVNNGGICFSYDGISWKMRRLQNADYSAFVTLSYSPSLDIWVAASSDVILYSTDTITWTRATYSAPAGFSLRKIIWNPIIKKFVGVGMNGTLAMSSDGINWTTSCVGGYPNYWDISVNSAGLMMIAGFNVYTNCVSYSSSDGVSWTLGGTVTATTGLIAIACSGTVFAIATDDGVFTSTNGVAWTNRGVYPLDSITFANGLFFTPSTTTSSYYTSSDGITWDTHSMPASEKVRNVTYAGFFGKYFSNSASGMQTSLDGISWTYLDPQTRVISCSLYIDKLGLWVVFGNAIMAYSSDGRTWAASTFGGVGVVGDAVYNKKLGLIIATVYNEVIYSSNGINWTIGSVIESTHFTKIACDQISGYVVMLSHTSSDNDYTYASKDLITWTKVVISSGKPIYGLIHNDLLGLFFAVISDGGVYTSPDGLAWTLVGTLQYSMTLREYCEAYGTMLYTGGSVGAYQAVGISSDGIHITLYATPVPVSESVTAASWSSDLLAYIIATATGRIYISTDLIEWEDCGSIDASYAKQIRRSSDLAQWMAVVGDGYLYQNLGDLRESYIHKLKEGSDLFSLRKGRNVLQLTSSYGAFYATVTYRKRYLGV
jgi:hypothetical protein